MPSSERLTVKRALEGAGMFTLPGSNKSYMRKSMAQHGFMINQILDQLNCSRSAVYLIFILLLMPRYDASIRC